MFVLLIISFYNVLISNEGQGPERYVDVPGVVVKTLSISGVPSIILVGYHLVYQKTMVVD